MTMTLLPRRVVLVLLTIMVLLTAIHVAVLVIYFAVDDPERFDFVQQIDFDYEGNVPTLFSALLLWVGALLFCVHAHRAGQSGDEGRCHWLGLAAVFAFLGLDEGVGIHEEIGDLMELVVTAEGFLYFPWFIPYSVAVVGLAIVYWPFVRRLPWSTRRGLTAAAVTYLAGAVGFDILGARQADLYGTETVAYSVLYTVEEVLEMVGIIALIHTLLTYLERTAGTITLRLGSGTTTVENPIKDPP